PYFGGRAIYVTSNDPELVVLPAPRNPTRSTANLTGCSSQGVIDGRTNCTMLI
ncbi:unnamed protein product, partial [Musa hybrid cultivar]